MILSPSKTTKPIIPVHTGFSGGRSGSTATSSEGSDLQRKNPQYVVEKAEIAAKQTAEQLNVDTRRLEKAKKELVSLQARETEEARIKAEKARALFEVSETDIEAQLRVK